MSPTSYTPELVAMLREEYEAGMTARELATKYRLDRAAVMRRLRAVGTKIRREGLTPNQTAKAAALYESGLTLAEVSATFEVSAGTVGRYLKREGICLRPPLVKAHST